MKIIKLPTHKPHIETIPEHCVLQSIIPEGAQREKYLFYYFIQLIVNKDVTKKLSLNFCYGDNYHLIDHNPAFDSYRIPDEMIKSKQHLRKLIHRALKSGYYIYLCVDKKDIHLYKGKIGEDGARHDILVYGENRNSYYVSDFFDKHYAFDSCPCKEVLHGYLSSVEMGKGSGFQGIYLIKPIAKDEFVLDKEFVISLLQEYISGANSIIHYLPIKQSSLWGNGSYVFGVNIYDILISYIEIRLTKQYEIRSFHILYEHKRIIKRLVEYFYSLHLISACGEMLDDADKMVEMALMIRNYVVKSQISLKDYSKIICEKLIELREFETKFISRLIELLGEKKISSSEFDGYCEYIGYDSETGGYWEKNYGKKAYFIFGNCFKECQDVTIRYYGFDDKTWTIKPENDKGQILVCNGAKWASCKFFTDTAELDINVCSDNPVRVSIYVCDIYGYKRYMEIKVIGGAVPDDSQTVVVENSGKYVSYMVKGRIRFKMINKCKEIGVISAIFID